MSFTGFLFLLFGAVVLLTAIAVVTSRNPVHAALFLVLSFVSTACIWLLLEAEFLAITLVLVYVGAVMVLFLFVVMMLDINLTPLREGFARYLPLGLIVFAIIFVEVTLVLLHSQLFNAESFPKPEPQEAGFSNTEWLGQALYTEYLYAFEIAAAILLVAIVAAIVLAHRRREGTRYQDVSAQLKVQPRDRVRLVQMPSESEK